MSAPVYDVDVHHTWGCDAELLAYLDPGRRRYFEHAGVTPPSLFYSRTGGTVFRLDAEPEGGGVPGSDYDLLASQVFGVQSSARVLLTFGIGKQEAVENPHAAAALCRAANDWSIDRWLERDDRLHGVLLVPTGQPDEAAHEIRRLGGHDRIGGVLVFANPLNKPFGHRVYDPIYEAACEYGLVVVLHVSGETAGKGGWFAGGLPTTKPEYYAAQQQPAMHHLGSLIVGGAFDRFPELRVLISEFGFDWVPWLLWGLDARYREIRRENPSVRKLPSEYFHEHVWLTTQPFDPPVPETQRALLDAFGGFDDKLCFASDYPHWDCDNAAQVASRIPGGWRGRVMHDNAARLFSWPLLGERQVRSAA